MKKDRRIDLKKAFLLLKPILQGNLIYEPESDFHSLIFKSDRYTFEIFESGNCWLTSKVPIEQSYKEIEKLWRSHLKYCVVGSKAL